MKNTLVSFGILAVAVLVGFLLLSLTNIKEVEEETSDIEQTMNTNELIIEVLEEGNGAEAVNGKTVTVDYVGTLTDGTTFDSSIDRGQPFSFTLGVGEVIAGWDQGVAGMKIGEKRRLTIPPDLAYGDRGAGGVIPPGATLIFEVKLLGVK